MDGLGRILEQITADTSDEIDEMLRLAGEEASRRLASGKEKAEAQTVERFTGTVPQFVEQCASALWASVALTRLIIWFVNGLLRFDVLCPIQMQVPDNPGNFLKRTIIITGIFRS